MSLPIALLIFIMLATPVFAQEVLPIPPGVPVPSWDPASGKCSNVPAFAPSRNWLVSAPRWPASDFYPPVHPGDPFKLSLIWRGEGEMPDAIQARVIGNGQIHVSEMRVHDSGAPQNDIWGDVADVWYPYHFGWNSVFEPGTYTVLWYADGGFVACDGFMVIAP